MRRKVTVETLNFLKLPQNGLPGQELVAQGLEDLAHDRLSESALLLLVAAPRLRRLGIDVQFRHFAKPIEHLLYEHIEERLGVAAHSYYNSLIRRIVSFARALEASANLPVLIKHSDGRQ